MQEVINNSLSRNLFEEKNLNKNLVLSTNKSQFVIQDSLKLVEKYLSSRSRYVPARFSCIFRYFVESRFQQLEQSINTKNSALSLLECQRHR